METLSKFYYKVRVNLFPFKCFLFLVKLRYNCLISFWLKKGKLVAILEIFLFWNCLKRCRNICFEGRRFLQDIVTTKFTKKKIKSLKIIKNIKMQLILIFCTIKRNFFFWWITIKRWYNIEKKASSNAIAWLGSWQFRGTSWRKNMDPTKILSPTLLHINENHQNKNKWKKRKRKKKHDVWSMDVMPPIHTWHGKIPHSFVSFYSS